MSFLGEGPPVAQGPFQPWMKLWITRGSFPLNWREKTSIELYGYSHQVPSTIDM